MSTSPPVAVKTKHSSEKQISDLADADLSAIFECLPPYDRLIASEACRRWYELSRKAWLDVTQLDLSYIPGKSIGAVVNQCPNLLTVFALKKSFELNELSRLSQGSKLAVVKLYDCNFAVKGDLNASFEAPNDVFAKIFSENLQHSSFRELILHNGRFEDQANSPGSRSTTKWAFAASYLPASLTHLQLSQLHVNRSMVDHAELLLKGLDRLEGLECLMLHQAPIVLGDYFGNDIIEATLVFPSIVTRICALKNLRELSVGHGWPITVEDNLGRLIANLPKLEVLHLNDTTIYDSTKNVLAELITTNSVLRILVISGYFRLPLWAVPEIELPARKRFPNGFGSDPLPLLHIFVGREASEGIRFAASASDAAIIHLINEPMPQFLVREDIAPIFAGVWIAEKIKAAAKFGGERWSHEQHDNAT